jgi:hypothetical protein
MDSGERQVRTADIRIPYARSPGSCLALSKSIETEGLHRPITLWSDGTLVSGRRRLFAYMLLGRERIPAVYVNTIEEAAKRTLADNLDDQDAIAWKWSEVGRWWELMRRLDEPAAVRRRDEARRRGVRLRQQTQAGKRKPGRAQDAKHSEDYVLTVLCEPFGISGATAKRIETIFQTGYGTRQAPDEKRELARNLMAQIDTGTPVWPCYERLLGPRPPRSHAPKAPKVIEPATAARQVSAWQRSLPQLEGLVAGLAELGPPNPDLTWNEVGPVHTRLMAIRRELEKMIKQLRETDKS